MFLQPRPRLGSRAMARLGKLFIIFGAVLVTAGFGIGSMGKTNFPLRLRAENYPVILSANSRRIPTRTTVAGSAPVFLVRQPIPTDLHSFSTAIALAYISNSWPMPHNPDGTI